MEGGLDVGGAPHIHSIFGHSQAWHLHFGRSHMHGSNHEGTVLLDVWFVVLPM